MRFAKQGPGFFMLLTMVVVLEWMCPALVWAQSGPTTPETPETPSTKPASKPDPIKNIYTGYKPPFLDVMAHYKGWQRSRKEMELSFEKSFYTLNVVDEDKRANALIAAGIEREEKGLYREAVKIYQMVLDQFSNKLYRVSEYGVFVPISVYCQRRILNFPEDAIKFYRTSYDAEAKEAFEQARRQYSLIGFSEIVNKHLATNYGDNALFELGNAGLDNGHYQDALNRFTTLRDFFPKSECRTAELDLKIQYCRKMLGQKIKPGAPIALKGKLSARELAGFKKVVSSAKPPVVDFHEQRASQQHVSIDDYSLMPPTLDPMALKKPVWTEDLEGTRRNHYLYAKPVVTDNSVIFRHRNVVYAYSILNGKLRWTSNLGGRRSWQSRGGVQYNLERILVQDGMVFTPISKLGASLVALDQVTGQLQWAFGPIVASTPEEARMRFMAVPAGGPRTVFASYILDNIDGNTHTDSEYGLMAFESSTGRIRWRRPICRLNPGKFTGGFATRVINRIRSFAAPPIYHEGVVYLTTNAGTVTAVDALSGRINWLMRYPYYPGVHDSTRGFGRAGGPHSMGSLRPPDPMLWLNQRPLLVDDRLYVTPVDTNFIFCMERNTGKVIWCRPKSGPGHSYLLGLNAKGELVLAFSGRDKPIQLLDPQTGKLLWASGDLAPQETQPVIRDYLPVKGGRGGLYFNSRYLELAARPFLTRDNKLFTTQWSDASYCCGWRDVIYYNLTEIDLNTRKIVQRRRYLTGEFLSKCAATIERAQSQLPTLESLPHKSKAVLESIKIHKRIAADSIPQNEHGLYRPFSRVTFKRYGVPFELRFGTRSMEMVYDIAAVRQALAKRKDPEAVFGQAELAFFDGQFAKAAGLFKTCLSLISNEDLDFRAAVNQQLYRVQQTLARSAIRTKQPEKEIECVLGMSTTATTLAEEMETLFALADAYQRKGSWRDASRCLQSIIRTYGHHEFPLPDTVALEFASWEKDADAVVHAFKTLAGKSIYSGPFSDGMSLMRTGLPLYASTLAPLPKNLTIRAGEWAAHRMLQLRRQFKDMAQQLETDAQKRLQGGSPEEQMHHIWTYPGTQAAQKVLSGLLDGPAKDDATRKQHWILADAARVGGLALSEEQKTQLLAPAKEPVEADLPAKTETRERVFQDAEGAARIILERRGRRDRHPQLAFIGARVRKRLDNKFTLTCLDTQTGKMVWETKNIRLRGTGQEPGFFEAFVFGDLVLVHGLYDVLAYTVKDGQLSWRYRVPFDFEIQHAVMNGNLLVVAGEAESIALYVPTAHPDGEVAWQEKEMGNTYIPPYFHGDRYVTVRKLPFNVTVRYRGTGKMIGRLDLPDLSLFTEHPLVTTGRKMLPYARDKEQLIVTDGWYYIALNVDTLQVLWKRLIDRNDATREPPLRFALNGDYLAVVKQDYDAKSIYMLNSRTGAVLWYTDPKNPKAPRPMYSMFIKDNKLYGIGTHPGQGFYLQVRDCPSGKLEVQTKVEGYAGKPIVRLFPRRFGARLAVSIQDRQDVEMRVFDLSQKGKCTLTRKLKGVGPFGVPGRVSATVQGGHVLLLNTKMITY